MMPILTRPLPVRRPAERSMVLDQFDGIAERGTCLCQPLLFVCRNEFVRALWRISQSSAGSLDNGEHSDRIEIVLGKQEVVGVKDIDLMRRHRFFREILQVEGHDRIGMPDDCAGEHVPVVGIGEVKGVDQVFVMFNEAVFDGIIHQLDGPGKLLVCQVGSFASRLRVHS